MRYRASCYGMIVACILSLLPVLQASTKKDPIDIQIAKYSAIIGSNRLNKDIADEKGLLLIRLCGALDRKNETYLFTCNLVRKGLKPDVIATHVDEAKLLAVMQSRVLKLYKTSYPKNKKVSKLIMLYGKVIEQFKPREKDVLVTLEALAQEGVSGALDELLATEIDLKQLFAVDTTTPAPKIADVVAPTPDVMVAEDIDFKIELPADKGEFEKCFVLDERVEVKEGAIKLRKKHKEFKHETVVLPKRGGGIRTRFALVNDFTFTFKGGFDRINVTVCGRTVKLSGDKVDGLNWYKIERRGNTISINGAKRASTKIYDFEVVGTARTKPSPISIDCKYAREDGWIRQFRILGKGIWLDR